MGILPFGPPYVFRQATERAITALNAMLRDNAVWQPQSN